MINKSSHSPRIVLLNPPGEKFYVRDYYCSKVSKGSYLYHPTDLLVLSGWLHDLFSIRLFDCIAEDIGPDMLLSKLREFAPDAVIILTGSVSRIEDAALMARIKTELGCLIIGTGDYLLDEFLEVRSAIPCLDAIILDFTTNDTRNFLLNELCGSSHDVSLVVDLRCGIPNVLPQRKRGGEFTIPVPRYELFPNNLYSYPFVRNRPFATVLTDYGCPYRCRFCVMAGLGTKLRTVSNVIEELDHVHSMGFRDVYFMDQTFGHKRKRFEELLNAIIERQYGFRWVAFTRADLIDESLIKLIIQSGGHTLMFGVENPNQRVLDQQKKDLKVEDIEKAFRLCKHYKIRTLATFVIGLPGTTYEENLAILDFAIKIDATYASFNVLIPRIGTEVRVDAKENDWIVGDDGSMDQSGFQGAMRSDKLNVEQIMKLRREITRGFYCRPSYFVKQLRGIRTVYDANVLLRNAWTVLSQALF